MATDRTITRAASRADRNPTDAQKAAGNYTKGHVVIHGMRVTIENARGSRRSGVGHGGRKWSVTMPAHYGYVKGTEGADGDHHDVYVGPVPHSPIVYVIDQKNAETGKFDEHKSMLGFATGAHALAAYKSGFSDGKGGQRMGGMTAMPVHSFKHWIGKGKTKHPLWDASGKIKSFDEGGAVDDDTTGSVASPPQWDALSAAPPKWEELNAEPPKWDALQAEPPAHGDQPQLSAGASAAVSGLRAAIPAAGAIPTGAAGAELGAMAGAPFAPFTAGLSVPAGALIGAFGGAYLGGKLTGMAQDKALDLAGVKETVDKYTEAAQSQHPYASFAGDLAPNIAAFNFSRAAPAAARVLAGGIMAAGETVNEGLGNEGLDPIKIAAAGAFGAAFNKPTALGERLMGVGTRFVPGRPDKQASSAETVPDVAADKQDAASSEPPKVAVGASEVQPPPDTDVSIGNPASAATRSDRAYPKDQTGPEPASINPGEVSPDVRTALNEIFGEDTTNANELSKGTDPGAQPQPEPATGAPQEPVRSEAPREGGSEAASGGQGDQPPAGGEGQPGGFDTSQVAETAGERGEDIPAFLKRDKDNKLPDVGPEMFNTPDEPNMAAGPVKAFLADEKGSISPAQFYKMTSTLGGAFKGPIPHVEGYQARKASGPQEKYSREVADELHTVTQQDMRDRVEMRDTFEKQLPGVAKDAKIEEELYHAAEKGDIASLPATHQHFYQASLEAARKHSEALYKELRKYDPTMPATDPNYMHKVAKGHQSEFEPDFMGADTSDPVMGARGLSKRADSLEAPTFLAIEAPTGQRAVISPADGGFNLWHGRNKTFVKSNDDLEMGGSVKIGNAKFDIKRANTAEVEQHALNREGKPMEYYKNAAYSILKNNLDLRIALRHAQYLEGLKKNPEFTKYATTDEKLAQRNGWQETKMRQFKGWYMDPHLADAFNDFAKPGVDGGAYIDKLRGVSQRVTSTLFWMPVPHMMNVFWHWWVGRGWDWIKPNEYRHLAGELADSWGSVMRQDAFQKQLADHGAGTIAPSIVADSRNLARNLAEAVGIDIKRDPSKWDPIAKTLGVDPRDLVHSLYQWSSRTMWQFNDVLLTHQVKANMRNGMDIDQAIKHAERHIPNYRMPSRILGSGDGGRIMAQVLSDPLLVSFGRYHYGVYNSLAHIAKGLATGSGGERREALGNVFALGLLAFLVKPILDQGAKYLTGNPEAEAQPRGPMAPIGAAKHALSGDNINRVTRGTVSLSPLFRTALETLSNQDFAGRNIVEPGNMQHVVPHSPSEVPGALRHLGAAVVQGGAHALGNLVAPVGQAEQAYNKGQGPLGALRDITLDIRNPSERSTAYALKAPMKNEQALRSRDKNPRSMFEAGYGAITGR